LVAGSLSVDEDYSLPYLIKMDFWGNTEWEKTYGAAKINAGLFMARELEDRTIIACGQGWDASDSQSGLILKVAANGDSIWMRDVELFKGPDSESVLRDIRPTSDKGFIAIGQGYPRPPDSATVLTPWRQDLWILKTDSLGCDMPGCELAPIGIGEEFSEEPFPGIFPNPFKDKLWVKDGLRGYEISVYSVDGKSMVNIKLPYQGVIETHSWASGEYIYMIGKEGKQMKAGKLIK
jgi:hypothetical protein